MTIFEYNAISPILRLLLSCARVSIQYKGSDISRIARDNDIDWSLTLQTAIRHGLMPLLYWHLKNAHAFVPKPFMEGLRRHFYTNLRRNILLSNEALRFLKLFQKKNINAIPYKGPVLAISAYRNLALRQFCDIDIFVQEKDVERAKAIIISREYEPGLFLTDDQAIIYQSFQCQYNFLKKESRHIIELHWRILPRHAFPLDVQYLKENMARIKIDGAEVMTFGPESSLLIQCCHGAQHCWQYLGLICDIAKLIESNQSVNWHEVMRRARRLSIERTVMLGTWLAHDLLDTRLPNDLLQDIAHNPLTRRLAQIIKERLFGGKNENPGLFANTNFKPLYLKMMKPQERKRYLLGVLMMPNENDLALVRLRSIFSFVYLLLRPIRLVLCFGLRSARRLFRQKKTTPQF